MLVVAAGSVGCGWWLGVWVSFMQIVRESLIDKVTSGT